MEDRSVQGANTTKNRVFVWKQFVRFCAQRGHELMRDSTAEHIAFILTDWATNMRKCNGEDYKEYSVKTIWNVTAKIIQEKYMNECSRNINPFFDDAFKCAREARDAKRKELQNIPDKRKGRRRSYSEEDSHLEEAAVSTQPGSSTSVEMPVVVTHNKKRLRTEKREDEEHQLLQLMKQNIKPSDEYSAFGEFVSHKIRKLRTERLRSIAQSKISNILFELEMSEENQCPTLRAALMSSTLSSAPTPELHRSSTSSPSSPPLQPVLQVKTEAISTEESFMFEPETDI